jgi:hypothetical protein
VTLSAARSSCSTGPRALTRRPEVNLRPGTCGFGDVLVRHGESSPVRVIDISTRDRLGLPSSVAALVRPGGLDADITAHPSREAGPRRVGMDVATARADHRRRPVRGGFDASWVIHE